MAEPPEFLEDVMFYFAVIGLPLGIIGLALALNRRRERSATSLSLGH